MPLLATMPSLDALREKCSSPLPQPEDRQIEEAVKLLGDYVQRDFLTLPAAPLGRTASRPHMEGLLREPAPEGGTSFAEALRQFHANVAPYSLRPSHPRFLAFIPGAPSIMSILGDWLCAGINFFCGVWKEAPGATEVEILVLDWFKQWLGHPNEAQGVVTSGGSEANLIALVAARQTLPRSLWPQTRAYVCQQRHWSVDRSFMVMGTAPEQIRPVAVDEQARLSVDALAQAVANDRRGGRTPWLVVANAGATNTGAVDPLAQLAAFCKQERLWLHVDAAYGWSAVLCERGRAALAGIDQADSLTLDPHKWLAQPFGAGCVLVRDGRLLRETFQMRPEYMQDVVPAEDEINFADHGIALTRRFRALKIWLSIKVQGLGWFRRLIDHCLDLASYSEALLRSRGCFELVMPASLSVVCFRYRPRGVERSEAELDEINLALCEKLRETGRAFLSTTRWQGKVCLRFCFVNYRTTAGDVEEIVGLLERLHT